MLPGMDGYEVLKALRSAGHSVPVILITGRGALPDRVRGLEGGADDYLVKPFEMEELVARVRAIIRRAGSATDTAEATPPEPKPFQHRARYTYQK